MEQQIRFCTTSDGVRIAYATVGQGPPLIRVLGWFTHLELEWENPRWRRIQEGMASRFTYTRYDGRGTGLSDRDVSDLSLTVGSASDLEAVINATGFDKVALYGVSQGGLVAIAYAVRNPDRVSHLIIYGASINPPWPEDQYDTMLSLVRQGWGLYVKIWVRLLVGWNSLNATPYVAIMRASHSPASFRAALKVVDEHHPEAFLDAIRAPTLIVYHLGDEPAANIARMMASRIADSYVAAVPPHPSDDPADETAAILDFISSTAAARRPVIPELNVSAVHTILFTDVEGSTALTQRLGDAKARELLREHERMVRQALNAHGGSEVKTMGDGFMASFSSATKALECAIAVQQAFSARNESAEEPIKVRVGLNAGEPIAEDDDLFGTAVNEAARITATAKGGEILVSSVVRELAKGKDFLFSDAGERQLKGFDEPVRLFEVRWREVG